MAHKISNDRSFLKLTSIGCTSLCLFFGLSLSVMAQIKVGVTVSATGPAASLGLSEKNAFSVMPTTIAGQKVEYIILDDASDPVSAVKNTRKLISEDKVDIVLGSTTAPNSLAMVDVVSEAQTPMIAMASSLKIVDPVDAKRFWVFKVPQNDAHMVTALSAHMADTGIKNVALIGFNDAYGEGLISEFGKMTGIRKLNVVATERYARTDTSVTGQVLKVLATNPDAVLIAASGTPAVLPFKTLKERGYKGKVYFTDGVINEDFLRVGGKDLDGSFLPAGPFVVANQLPDSNPSKKIAIAFADKYDKAYGVGTHNQFAGHAHDVIVVLEKAIPLALKKAKPGTPEFRTALRDALETMGRTVVAHGTLNWTKEDHWGYTPDTGVMLKVVDGQFTVAP